MHKHWLKRKSLLRIHVVRLHTELQASREMDIWRATSELMCTFALAVTLHCRTRRHAHNAARTEVLRRCRFAKLELGQVSMHQVTIQNRTLNLRVPRVIEEGHVGYSEAHRNLHGAQKLGGALSGLLSGLL